MSKRQEFSWVICYVNAALLNKLPTDLQKSPKYSEVRPHIPMVRVLKKQFKNKEYFDEVPLLFNYGFFKVPIGLAINTDLMMKMKEDISCISGWVRDGAKRHGSREDEKTRDWVYTDSNVAFATVKEETVALLVEEARKNSIFSSDDIKKIKPDDIIFLMGYPFEGMQAKVISIDTKAKKLKVLLGLDIDQEDWVNGREVQVHFENVFYSLYQGSHDENYNQEKLLEDYNLNRKRNHGADL